MLSPWTIAVSLEPTVNQGPIHGGRVRQEGRGRPCSAPETPLATDGSGSALNLEQQVVV